MGTRKTGKDVKIEAEIGSDFYPWNVLSTVSSPAADIGKKFVTSATFISDDEDRQAEVRLDGVVSGFTITAGSGNNEVDVSSGTGYLLGSTVTVTGTTISDLERPTGAATYVKVTALSVDTNGTINKTVGTEGNTSSTRGAAGGPPFIPENEFLIGYVTMTYYGGSVSGAAAVTAGEINSDTKEYANIPSFSILHHDGSGNDAQNVGCIQFASVLPLIHGAGSGTARRNVYAQYYDAIFEEVPDTYDFNFTEDVSVIESRAYRDPASKKALGTPSWSSSGSAYFNAVNDVLSLLKNKKRWYKHYPDADETPYYAGLAIWTVSRNFPVEDTLNAAVTVNGDGELYAKLS